MVLLTMTLSRVTMEGYKLDAPQVVAGHSKSPAGSAARCVCQRVIANGAAIAKEQAPMVLFPHAD